jgi:uncharacterized protein YqeY
MSSTDSLVDRISEDLKDAMRSKDKIRLRTLRSLRSALQNKEIEQRKEGAETVLSEQDELTVLRKQVNQRKESIEQYEDAGREDLVHREQEELKVLQEYMPDQLTDEDLRSQLEAIIDDLGASSMADMGPVMGTAMEKLRGRVDGSRVQAMVKDLLSEDPSS